MTAPRGSRVVVHGRPTTGFLQVPNELLRDPGLTVGARSVVLWLASQAASRTVYRASGARELGVKPHTFTKYTDEAAATKWLEVEDTDERDRQGHPVVVFHVNLSEQATHPLPENGSGPLPHHGSGHCPKTADKKTKEEDQRETALDTRKLGDADTADVLVGAWAGRAQPPREVVARVHQCVASLLAQGAEANDVREGLRAMDAKGWAPTCCRTWCTRRGGARSGAGRARTRTPCTSPSTCPYLSSRRKCDRRVRASQFLLRIGGSNSSGADFLRPDPEMFGLLQGARMTATRPPKLGRSGRKLWDSITSGYDLGEHELSLLLQAARTADLAERLQEQLDRLPNVITTSPQGDRVHPLLVELRQQRLALARLLVALRVPEEGAALLRGQRRGIRGVYRGGAA